MMYVFVFGQNIPIPELLLILLIIAVVFIVAVYFAYKRAEGMVTTQTKQITNLSDTIEDLADKLGVLSSKLDEQFVVPIEEEPIKKTKPAKIANKTKIQAEVEKIQKEVSASLKEVKKIKEKRYASPKLSETALKRLEDKLRKNIDSVNQILEKTSDRVQREVRKG